MCEAGLVLGPILWVLIVLLPIKLTTDLILCMKRAAIAYLKEIMVLQIHCSAAVLHGCHLSCNIVIALTETNVQSSTNDDYPPQTERLGRSHYTEVSQESAKCFVKEQNAVGRPCPGNMEVMSLFDGIYDRSPNSR